MPLYPSIFAVSCEREFKEKYHLEKPEDLAGRLEFSTGYASWEGKPGWWHISTSSYFQDAELARVECSLSKEGVLLNTCNGLAVYVTGLSVGKRTIARAFYDAKRAGNEFGFEPMWAYAYMALGMTEYPEDTNYLFLTKAFERLGFKEEFGKGEEFVRLSKDVNGRWGIFDWTELLDRLLSHKFNGYLEI